MSGPAPIKRDAPQPSGVVDRISEVWNPYQPEQLAGQGLDPVRIEESGIRKTAARALMLAMIAFLIWAFFAPIDQGVSVPGRVDVQGNRKAVQHPKGGVIQDILVKEGDVVKQGDVLIKMNPLLTEAELTSTELQYINLLATESRLLAERLDQPRITWRPGLVRYGNDPRAIEARQLQTQLFITRAQDLRGQREILAEQIAGLQAQSEGLQSVLKARQAQLRIVAEEAKNNRELADEGYVPRSRANEVARALSELTANLASTSAELAKTRASIASTRLQLAQLRTAHLKEIDTSLADTQKQREGLQSKVESLRFEKELTELRAPVSGTVVGAKVHTVGGVVTGGQVLMEIVPSDGRLIIDAQVPPREIDKVRTGMEADLRFTAFSMTTTPVIPGIVKLVGADRVLPDASKGEKEEYYVAQVEVTPEGRRLLGSLQVQPGMPVDVIIKAGERTFVSYFTKPITDRFARAFKER